MRMTVNQGGKHMRLTYMTAIGLCVVLTASTAMAKEKKAEKQMDPQAMMEEYKKLATPGEDDRRADHVLPERRGS